MDKIKFYLIAGSLAMVIILALDFVIRPDEKDILVEAHGMLFDILLFGIILAIFDSVTEKRTTIRRYLEEVDDFREWESEEAKSRIIGNLKRLIRLGVNEFDLSDCYLANTQLGFLSGKITHLRGANLSQSDLRKLALEGLDLSQTTLKGANLAGADLRQVNLLGISLEGVNLMGANLMGVDLRGCRLDGANLQAANLQGVDLRGASLIDVQVHEASFQEADLREVKFLRQEDADNFAKMGIIQFQSNGGWQDATLTGARFSKISDQISFTQFPNSQILEVIGIRVEDAQLSEEDSNEIS
ncbi:MAG: pentapeptide repeat-containing protein [Bacteroidota bacterium]